MNFLKPSKHTNLRYSIINISAQILKEIKANSIIEYHELLERLQLTIGKDVKILFHISLSFLYMHKKIEYLKDFDCFRLKQ